MRFWENLFQRKKHAQTGLGHELVIGPLCDHPLFSRKARFYFCVRCRGRFLVRGNAFAVVDKRGNVLDAALGADRSESLEESLCPARETRSQIHPTKAYIVHLRPPGKFAEPRAKAAL